MKADIRALAEVERELLAIREHLRRGDLAAMAAASDALPALLDRLPPPDDAGALASLRRIRALAQECLPRIAAARTGVRVARTRVRMLWNAATSLQTYDRLGRASTVTAAGPDTDQRA